MSNSIDPAKLHVGVKYETAVWDVRLDAVRHSAKKRDDVHVVQSQGVNYRPLKEEHKCVNCVLAWHRNAETTGGGGLPRMSRSSNSL
ncbi:hypothetical protein [Polaromonas sp.]|uniref:hypothetical protein n=1 Tax=Polaromonas sp. TaxID=1869339 RepID=UPI002FCC54B9